MIIGQEQLFFEQIEAASKRYAATQSQYQFKQGQLQGGSTLQMDHPDRVVNWLVRGARMRTTASTSLDEFVQERIIGGNDLMGVQFLQMGMSQSAAVGRVVVRGVNGATRGFGTGFLVAPALILTNHHVLPDSGTAVPSMIQFNFQMGPSGEQTIPANFRLRPDLFFTSNASLDFTICGVALRGESQEALADFGFVRILEETGKIVEGNPVNIIQHPSGQLKQIAIRANRLIHVLDEVLHYETDTAPGSSGSPVFNDQWELVSLHHAGVPRKNADGQVQTKDGSIWTPDKGEEQIDWIANEGIRASSIARIVKSIPDLTTDQRRLRDSIFEATARSATTSDAGPVNLPGLPVFRADGTITWSFPSEFSIRVPGLTLPGAPSVASDAPTLAAVRDVRPSPRIAERRKEVEEQRKLVDAAFAEAAGKKYFDKAADTAAAKTYYAGIAGALSAKKRYEALHKLLKSTHKTKLSYKPAMHLYPWVDLQPGTGGAASSKVRSIYSGQMFSAKDFAEEDLRTEMLRLETAERLVREGSFPEETVIDSVTLEATLPFNCEHVVPQSWFQRNNPMRGDLHHLFACESGCNSFRGNTPYFDFPDFEEVLRTACGKREEDRFEPSNGKGEVARATLYFLLRYPGQIAAGRLSPTRLPVLLDWHTSNKVTDHERHRNAAIFAAQGNRNPLIDHPEWAADIEFVSGLTSPTDEALLTVGIGAIVAAESLQARVSAGDCMAIVVGATPRPDKFTSPTQKLNALGVTDDTQATIHRANIVNGMQAKGGDIDPNIITSGPQVTVSACSASVFANQKG